MASQELIEVLKLDIDPLSRFEMLEVLGNPSYSYVILLGESPFCCVYKAQDKYSGNIVAIKCLSVNQNLDNIKARIAILQACKNPFIINCYDAYIKENVLWLVIEYCPAGSIFDLMMAHQKTLTEIQIGAILLSCLKGLEHLHGMKQAHRDIKASNIMLDLSGNVKLAEFGVSAETTGIGAGFHNLIGSPFWMSPEMISASKCNKKSDIWSLGITAIEMAEGKLPYFDLGPCNAVFALKDNPPQGLTEKEKWSSDFNNFVQKCLNVDPKQRPSAKELLEHPFIKNNPGKIITSELVSKSINLILEYRLEQAQFRQRFSLEKQFDLNDSEEEDISEDESNGKETTRVIYESFIESQVGKSEVDGTMILKGDSIDFQNSFGELVDGRETIIIHSEVCDEEGNPEVPKYIYEMQELLEKVGDKFVENLTPLARQAIPTENDIRKVQPPADSGLSRADTIRIKIKKLEKDLEIEIAAVKARYVPQLKSLRDELKALEGEDPSLKPKNQVAATNSNLSRTNSPKVLRTNLIAANQVNVDKATKSNKKEDHNAHSNERSFRAVFYKKPTEDRKTNENIANLPLKKTLDLSKINALANKLNIRKDEISSLKFGIFGSKLKIIKDNPLLTEPTRREAILLQKSLETDHSTLNTTLNKTGHKFTGVNQTQKDIYVGGPFNHKKVYLKKGTQESVKSRKSPKNNVNENKETSPMPLYRIGLTKFSSIDNISDSVSKPNLSFETGPKSSASQGLQNVAKINLDQIKKLPHTGETSTKVTTPKQNFGPDGFSGHSTPSDNKTKTSHPSSPSNPLSDYYKIPAEINKPKQPNEPRNARNDGDSSHNPADYYFNFSPNKGTQPQHQDKDRKSNSPRVQQKIYLNLSEMKRK